MSLQDWQKQFFTDIIGPDKQGKKQLGFRLQAYRDSILGSWLASLKTTYPALQRLIGEESFEIIIDDYLRKLTEHPADIGLLGKGLADYLQQHEIAKMLPYIVDLARYEWQWHLAFNAKEAEQFIATYQYQVDQIWVGCQPEYDGDFSDINANIRETTLLLRRYGLEVQVLEIDTA